MVLFGKELNDPSNELEYGNEQVQLEDSVHEP